MAYDETTANKIRELLAERADVAEKPMMGGGLGFMVDGNLCCGLSERGLTVRVGPERRTEALALNHVKPLRLGTREPKAFIVVEADGYSGDAELAAWVERGLRFVDTLD